MTRLAPVTTPDIDRPGQPDEAWLGFVTNRWSRTIAQPFLIATMMAALFAGPLIVLQIVIPATPWRSLIAINFLIALEGIYTTIWLTRPRQRGLNRLAYRSAEFLIIALLLRLLAWTLTNDWPDLDAWQTFLFEPLAFFNDGFFLVSLIIAFLTWQRALYTGDLFKQLALDRAEAAYFADAFGKHKLDTRPTMVDRSRLVAHFMQQWLWGAFILVICAAASTFDLAERAAGTATGSIFGLARSPLPLAMLGALILYFFAGFLLLSQGRLAMMNARWLVSGMKKSAQVERRWYRYSLRLLLLVGFIAAFLPLGSTIALSRIVAVIVAGVTAVIAFITALFLFLFSWLLPSFAIETEAAPFQPSPPAALPTPPPPSSTTTGETAAMVLSSAFWAVAIVVTVIAILFFLRERGVRLTGAFWRQWWSALRNWWTILWAGFSRQVVGVRQAVQRSRRAKDREKSTRSLPAWRFVRLNALSPREQLRYFYLSTVRRAGDSGVKRDDSKTPLEFANDLKENWPDVEADVESLTDAFLRARYSPKPIEPAAVSPVRKRWRRLRARLRQRREQRQNQNR